MASPLLYAQAPIGELNASPGSSVRGSLKLDGSGAEILSGSSLKAGDQPAELHLSRGGELRICPRSALAVSTPAPDSALLIGLNTGALELECSPKAFTDVILTPDLRLQLTGPGSFHLALGVRPNGDTCVRMLAGGASSLIINENMGEGAYQVRPGQSILFREGKLSSVVEDTGLCGCPEAIEDARLAGEPAPSAAAQALGPDDHVELDAPIAYIGDDEQMAMTLVAHLQLSREPAPGMQPVVVYQKKKGGFRQFLRRLFRRHR